MNDNGEVVGLKDARRLIEEVPNKIRDLLGLVVDVQMLHQDGKDYIEITINSDSHPISYRGEHYCRSGSTNQKLKGIALDTFLLRKQGRHWDGVLVPRVAVDDLSQSALSLFRAESVQSGRLKANTMVDDDETLLRKLHLMEHEHLKRAAVLLFHPDPDRFVSNAYIKIARFTSTQDFIFQDVVRGPLVEQVGKALDLLLTKYLAAGVSYEGAMRRERFPFPEKAIREALINAVAHKDYGSGTPIQIKVFDDRLLFWNSGQLPDTWTVETLRREHPSVPFNPAIANTLFQAAYIESWGTGTLRMIEECIKRSLPGPRFQFESGGCSVEFFEKSFTDASLRMLGLRSELIPIMLEAQTIGFLTNAVVRRVAVVSKSTATRYLNELERGGYLEKLGTTGPSLMYVPMGSQRVHGDE